MTSIERSTTSVLAIVQAGGEGSRMDVLTRERAKPALPFAGSHRLIDFTLSMLAHAGITEVWVSVQYLASSLDPYLAVGRPWDLDRTRGGLRRMVPQQGAGSGTQSGFSHGNADDLYRMRDDIELLGPRVVVVSSADHVVGTDLTNAIDAHLASGAVCTLLTARVGGVEAEQKMVLEVDDEGRVTSLRSKPDLADEQGPWTVSTEIAVYDAKVLVDTLDRIRHRLHETGAADEAQDPEGGTEEDVDTGLGDVGAHLLPALIEHGDVRALEVEGYWRDAGRPDAYLLAHRDLLDGRVDVFDDPARPVLGLFTPGPPARLGPESRVVDSMLAAGAVVEGEVRRSVLGPGVHVHPGARVHDSVLFADVVVEAGAQVRTSVVDERARIGRDARVGGDPPTELDADDVTLLGADAVVGDGAVVEAGGRLEPGATT